MAWGLITDYDGPESSGSVLTSRHRSGIETRHFGRWCFERCDAHRKEWREGDTWEENGGKACRECTDDQISGTAQVGDDTYIFRDASISRLSQAGVYSQLTIGSTTV